MFVEGGLVDDRREEIAEVGHLAHGDGGDLRGQAVEEVAGHRAGHVDPRRGRALLALILVGAPDRGCDGRLGIGGRVEEDEVLAAGLADDAGVVPVDVELVAHLAPEGLEDGRGAREMQAGEFGPGEHRLADGAAGAGQEVDDPGGEARLLVDLHDEIVGEDGRG